MRIGMLEVNNLTCGYNSKIILRGIHFQIGEGEILGIIGPNGSGKTTLLRAITKVIKPMEGRICFEGNDLNQMRHKDLSKKIALVSQAPQVGWMTVEEYVLLGRTPHYKEFQFLETDEDFEIASKWMRLTDIYRLKEKPMYKLSGGERQLAQIARALTQEPKLLLLDEPTAHLDITHQVGILDLIKRLNREFRLTVVLVLHDLNLASEYCERLILMNEGHIYRMGPPAEVLNYQTIEEVYKTIVVVKQNPISLKPFIFLISEEQRNKRNPNERI